MCVCGSVPGPCVLLHGPLDYLLPIPSCRVDLKNQERKSFHNLFFFIDFVGIFYWNYNCIAYMHQFEGD